MPRVVLNPGHGGEIYGDIYDNRYEKDDNLRIALAVGDILTQYGFEVYYTRTSDVTVPTEERIQFINEINPDLVVNFHRYSNPYKNFMKGAETLIYDDGNFAREVAERINENLDLVGFPTGSIIEIQPGTALFRDVDVPVVMEMLGFLNSEEVNLIFDTKFNEIALAIANGIYEAFQNDDKAIGVQEQEQEDKPDYRYRIQVGLFRSLKNALQYQEQLRQNDFEADIVRQGEFYALHVGGFDDLDEAAVWETVLRRAGYDTLVISVQ
ncbi:MAG: N-acetylmuramoyl-L-alanine amidase [Clostridiales bacterium]|nr:N-acetylmuramoyl-L-alanine amidase [Clostridiales bacterium]